jgi:hypothetical protein
MGIKAKGPSMPSPRALGAMGFGVTVILTGR